jgi:hypothetical protein
LEFPTLLSSMPVAPLKLPYRISTDLPRRGPLVKY